jgi:Ubiquitin family
MKITVTTLAEYNFDVDVSEDMELENFKALCEVESGFPSSEIVLIFKGRPLVDDKKTLKEFGISDGDACVLQHLASYAQTLQQQGERLRECIDTFRLGLMICNILFCVFDSHNATVQFGLWFDSVARSGFFVATTGSGQRGCRGRSGNGEKDVPRESRSAGAVEAKQSAVGRCT